MKPEEKVDLTALPLKVMLEDEPLWLHDELHVLLHKPAGVVTSLRDPVHPTAYTLVAHHPLGEELRAVGRLDLDCSGLLLWTTDGGLLHRMTHPRYAVPRTYHVALARPVDGETPPATLEDGTVTHVRSWEPLEPADAHPALLRPGEAEALAQIELDGGAYHEVKRIFAAMGSHVLALARVRHGTVTLPEDLDPGDSIQLPRETLEPVD